MLSLLFLLLSTLSTFTPSLTLPRRAGLVHLSVLSWEEVPSHLTLRKWFQCMLVWILAAFCNCQFPYQSVCISIGRTWATSPLSSKQFCSDRVLLLLLLVVVVVVEASDRIAGHCSWLCVCVRSKCLCWRQISCGLGEFVGHNLTPEAMYLAEMLDAVQRRGYVKKIFVLLKTFPLSVPQQDHKTSTKKGLYFIFKKEESPLRPWWGKKKKGINDLTKICLHILTGILAAAVYTENAPKLICFQVQNKWLNSTFSECGCKDAEHSSFVSHSQYLVVSDCFFCRRDNIYFPFCAAVVCQWKNAARHCLFLKDFFVLWYTA